MLRQPSTHAGLQDRELESDVADDWHLLGMMRHRLARCSRDESGFTLIELLVTMILLGILVAIALAVFLNATDKGKDVNAKSDVTNIAHSMQACRAGLTTMDDFRQCDDPTKLNERSFRVDTNVQELTDGADCSAQNLNQAMTAGASVKIVQSGPACFALLGASASGNRFSLVHHNDGSTTSNCTTHGTTGCPSNGKWSSDG